MANYKLYPFVYIQLPIFLNGLKILKISQILTSNHNKPTFLIQQSNHFPQNIIFAFPQIININPRNKTRRFKPQIRTNRRITTKRSPLLPICYIMIQESDRYNLLINDWLKSMIFVEEGIATNTGIIRKWIVLYK